MRPGLLEPAERPQSPTKLPQALSLAARVAQLPADDQTLLVASQRLRIPASPQSMSPKS